MSFNRCSPVFGGGFGEGLRVLLQGFEAQAPECFGIRRSECANLDGHVSYI